MPFWTSGIPPEIKDEIKAINKFTKKTGREASLTLCRKPGSSRLIAADHTEGNKFQTGVEECNTPRYGILERIGDVHSHVPDKDVIGITPSEPDFYTNLVDAHIHRRPQISCVTSPESDLNECFQSRRVPDQRRLMEYERALGQAQMGNPGFFIDNVDRDFELQFFDNPKGSYIPQPDPKRVVKAALGTSRADLRDKLDDFERGGFCEYVRATTIPRNEGVTDACRAELKKRNILGIVEF